MIDYCSFLDVANPSVNIIRRDFRFKPFSMFRKTRQIRIMNGIGQLLLLGPFSTILKACQIPSVVFTNNFHSVFICEHLVAYPNISDLRALTSFNDLLNQTERHSVVSLLSYFRG